MEMIIVIAILGIVGTMAFSTIDVGLRTHEVNSENVDIQSDLRLAAFQLIEEVRYVRYIGIYDSASETSGFDENIILESGRIKYTNSDIAVSDRFLSGDIIESLVFNISQDADSNKYILSITLNGENNNTLSTSVLLNNITSTVLIESDTADSDIIGFNFDVPEGVPGVGGTISH